MYPFDIHDRFCIFFRIQSPTDYVSPICVDMQIFLAFTVPLIANQVTILKQQSITSDDICFSVRQKEEE